MGKIVSNDLRDIKNRTQTYSFGVGRENMKKVHVEEILQNKNNIGNPPGAGAYEHKHGFGGTRHDAMQSRTCFSMRKKLYMDELKLEKSKKTTRPWLILSSRYHKCQRYQLSMQISWKILSPKG